MGELTPRGDGRRRTGVDGMLGDGMMQEARKVARARPVMALQSRAPKEAMVVNGDRA